MRRHEPSQRRRERCDDAARSDRIARTVGVVVCPHVASAHVARGDVRNRAAIDGGSFCEGGTARVVDVRTTERYGSLRSDSRESVVSGV